MWNKKDKKKDINENEDKDKKIKEDIKELKSKLSLLIYHHFSNSYEFYTDEKIINDYLDNTEFNDNNQDYLFLLNLLQDYNNLYLFYLKIYSYLSNNENNFYEERLYQLKRKCEIEIHKYADEKIKYLSKQKESDINLFINKLKETEDKYLNNGKEDLNNEICS